MATGDKTFGSDPSGNQIHSAAALSSKAPRGAASAISRHRLVRKFARTKKLRERLYALLCATVLGLALSLSAPDSAFAFRGGGFGGFHGGFGGFHGGFGGFGVGFVGLRGFGGVGGFRGFRGFGGFGGFHGFRGFGGFHRFGGFHGFHRFGGVHGFHHFGGFHRGFGGRF